MHEDPYLANEGKSGRGPIIQEGSVFGHRTYADLGYYPFRGERTTGWTVVTLDGSWASHWEHTVAATAGGTADPDTATFVTKLMKISGISGYTSLHVL